MKINDAIREMAKLGSSGRMTRPGGQAVRLAVGQEGALSRYVRDEDGHAVAFDASAPDLAADDWTVESVKPDSPSARADALPTPPATPSTPADAPPTPPRGQRPR